MPTRTSYEVVDWSLYYENSVNGVSSGRFGVTNPTRGSFLNSVTSGGPVSDWRGKIARLESATTQLSGGLREYRESGDLYGFVEFQQTVGVTKQATKMYGAPGANIGSPTSPSISLSRADNQALMEFVSRCNQEIRAVQSLVCFGEIGEILRGIRRPASALFKSQYAYLDRVKRNLKHPRYGWRNNFKRANEIVAGTWLEWAFGVRPLLADIKGAAEALSRIAVYTPPHKVVTARGKDRQVDSGGNHTLTGGFLRLDRRIENIQDAEVRYKGCIRALPPGFHGSLDAFGISLHEIVPTIYELIPYSFLVDYWTNLGSVISGASFNSSSLSWCERGTVVRHERTLTPTELRVVPPGSGWKEIGRALFPGGPSTCSWRIVNRDIYSGSFVPSLEFTIPGLGLKWLNIAALAASSRRVTRGFIETRVPL